MTREEEIKARLDEAEHVEYQKWGHGYCSEGGMDSFGDAEDDLNYLLARNEELQRRSKRLENVYEAAGKMVGLFLYRMRNGDGDLTTKTYSDVLKVREAFDAFYAKEQDDAKM